MTARREKQLVRAARKKLRKTGCSDAKAAHRIKIQTVATWKRVIIGVLSLVWLGFAAFFYESSVTTSLVFAAFFVVTAVFAIIGSRKSIDGALNGLDASVSDRVISSIFDGIF